MFGRRQYNTRLYVSHNWILWSHNNNHFASANKAIANIRLTTSATSVYIYIYIEQNLNIISTVWFTVDGNGRVCLNKIVGRFRCTRLCRSLTRKQLPTIINQYKIIIWYKLFVTSQNASAPYNCCYVTFCYFTVIETAKLTLN